MMASASCNSGMATGPLEPPELAVPDILLSVDTSSLKGPIFQC